jgi:DNA-binding transcriptional ArsR family regulator
VDTMNSTSVVQELEEQAIFEVLSHAIRRQILRELSLNILLAYSDFKQLLGHGPGVIYHHLQKLQELGFLYQRPDKQYELTSAGKSIVAYMNQATDRSIFTKEASTDLQNFFLNIPLAQIILENPRRWLLESSLLVLFLLILQIEFPILVVGFFLIPSDLSFPIRLGLQAFFFLVMALILEAGAFVWNPHSRNHLQFSNSLLIFPLLSAIGVAILWGSTEFISRVPEWFYWTTIGLLQGCYFYAVIHLLMHIKKLSFEQSAILALAISYLFFFCGYMLI